MPQPDYYAEGTDSKIRDTKLRLYTKILGATQNSLGGALSANNPKRFDTRRRLKQKWLCALDGVAFTG